MSKIQVNEIVNHFDNGAPDCPRGLTVTGVSTFSGNVSIGGTLSYEDVTNIDSVGIITAQSGIRVTGGDLSIEGSASQILSIFCNDTGVQATPRTFINLYGDNTANEKKLQAQIASAPGNVASSAGELHFSTNNSSSVITRRMTINQDGEVGIGTITPAEILHVEAGWPKQIIKSTNTNTAGSLIFDNKNITTADFLLGQIAGKWQGTDVAHINFEAGADTTNKDDGVITFLTSASGGSPIERLRIDSSGMLLVGTNSQPTGNNTNLRADFGRANTSTDIASISVGSGSYRIFNAMVPAVFGSPQLTATLNFQFSQNYGIAVIEIDLVGGLAQFGVGKYVALVDCDTTSGQTAQLSTAITTVAAVGYGSPVFSSGGASANPTFSIAFTRTGPNGENWQNYWKATVKTSSNSYVTPCVLTSITMS